MQTQPTGTWIALNLTEVQSEGLTPALGFGAIRHESRKAIDVGIGVVPDRLAGARWLDVRAHRPSVVGGLLAGNRKPPVHVELGGRDVPGILEDRRTLIAVRLVSGLDSIGYCRMGASLNNRR